MNKQELIRIIILLSQMECYVMDKVGSHSLPDYISEELFEVCDMLVKHIKGE